jgi:tetraacyldisaccharide 4'-kinase
MNRRWLAGFNPLYGAAVAWRNRRIDAGREPVEQLRWPVVSVGNLAAGGAGKTPLTIALAKGLMARGLRVDVLSRGYGRQSDEVLRVDPAGRADDFGDEPLEMARAAGVPVYVAGRRVEAGRLAEREAGEKAWGVHLLDDGFQHRQLFRDVDILLLSARDLRDRLLPGGNLREPLWNHRRATVVAVPAEEPEVEEWLREVIPIDRGTEGERWMGPIWRIRRRMERPEVEDKVFAFCGIARPEQFFSGLRELGVEVAGEAAFRDHHRYRRADLERLTRLARERGAGVLVTTEKDRARLGGLDGLELRLVTAGLRSEIEDETEALDWLAGRLKMG